MSISYHEMFHHIGFPSHHPYLTPTSSMLLLIRYSRYSFYVSLLTQRNHHILMGNKIFVLKLLSLFSFNSSAALVAIPLLKLGDILLNKKEYFLRICQKVFKISDVLDHLAVFIDYFLLLQLSQPA